MKDEFSTVGIFAHANAGKTTITESILHKLKVLDSIGRVDSGDTVSDNMSIEKESGISVKATLLTFELEKNKIIQIIDTPCHIDFSSEVDRAISVLDFAILVISAADGLEPQTFSIWKKLQNKRIPVIFFINKVDRDGANYKELLKDLRNS